ncbi:MULTISPECIES: RNA-guided endonuclease InsQ/TnpB family protein [unclassified Streptomyces]|uniref:RNA-guided endonuclease InsQ/TnpB family protein n=1 Tax=unclassified Streptomyces TaxID=2593676 RepID=UPI00099D6CD0|nr:MULTISPECIES: RNA-guided endonuclease TnpB family protein [unclassified Streptomyces]
MQLRYKFRLYPTQDQRKALANAFGCARTVYNDALRVRREAMEKGDPLPRSGDLAKLLITQAKKTPERAWLAETSNVVLQQALRDLDVAYSNFFRSLNGARKGGRVGKPKFRSRKDRHQAIRLCRNAFVLRPNGRLYVAKIGDVAVRWSRSLPSDPSSVTVIMDASGRYFASFVVETDPAEVLPEAAQDVGIDLGLTHFAVLSDGRKISSPKFMRRAERKLRKAQQAVSRKRQGSANRRKATNRVARLHAHVADARRDFHHKLSTTIIRENQAVYVEDLAVKGLARTRLAKSVHDAGWSQFTAMLEYKAVRYGRTFDRVDRWLPSSQTCHMCLVIDGPKPLSVRQWTCEACGAVHDRDVNAARIILAAGRAER